MYPSLTGTVLLCFASAVLAVPFTDSERRDVLDNPTYDYILVGGGTAGLVLAERLTENSNIQVAVIEAGTYYEVGNPALGYTPSADVLWCGSSPLDTNPAVDWNFLTEPQAGAAGRRMHYARGKCLGGTSARNFMIYQRGTRQSYQKWADAIGDQSYTFDKLMPYFKKSVHFTPGGPTRFANATAEYNAAAFDPAGGPLEVTYANYAQPFSTWLEPSLNEIGIPTVEDFNSGSLLGAQYCASTIRASDQKRSSSEASFLSEASGRSNLKVYSLTLAKKVIFDDSKKATGVEISRDAGAGLVTSVINARKEVIISAGAFQSPQLLMVSGIGPKATLDKFKIPVIADRQAVGQGMEDHVFFGPSYRVKVDTLTKYANDLTALGSSFLTEYTLNHTGPFTNPIADFLAWEKVPRSMISSKAVSDLARFPADWPEIEYITAPGYVGDFSSLIAAQPKDGYQYATVLGSIVAPLSRGTVTIASADTAVLPIIDPAWLTDPTDKEVAVAIYKRVRAAFATKAMSGVLADPKEYFPGEDVKTDEQILDVIAKTVQTIWHAACTCRMGKATDPKAVVDPSAKVIGVQSLRVVDASSFALLPPGHPQSTVYVFAEKIAAEILAGK